MATKFIVDTHALIWHLEGKSTLGSGARTVLDSPDSELVLPKPFLSSRKAEPAYQPYLIC
jgi:hypothetical protein